MNYYENTNKKYDTWKYLSMIMKSNQDMSVLDTTKKKWLNTSSNMWVEPGEGAPDSFRVCVLGLVAKSTSVIVSKTSIFLCFCFFICKKQESRFSIKFKFLKFYEQFSLKNRIQTKKITTDLMKYVIRMLNRHDSKLMLWIW